MLRVFITRKGFLVSLGYAVALYAPLELSRLTAHYWSKYGPVQPFWFELIWILLGTVAFTYCYIVVMKGIYSEIRRKGKASTP